MTSKDQKGTMINKYTQAGHRITGTINLIYKIMLKDGQISGMHLWLLQSETACVEIDLYDLKIHLCRGISECPDNLASI